MSQWWRRHSDLDVKAGDLVFLAGSILRDGNGNDRSKVTQLGGGREARPAKASRFHDSHSLKHTRTEGFYT